MTNIEDNGLPAQTWRVLGFAAVALLLITVVGIGLISAGAFDPKPVGRLQARSEPGERALAEFEQRLEWLELDHPGSFSVRLTAAYESGERDIGYGVALGSAQQHLVVEVSPLGYVTVWEMNREGRSEHMPWQRWPHVALQHAPNEIQMDVRNGIASVRVNREHLWQGVWESGHSQIGLYLESFGGPSVVRFPNLQLFYE